MEGDNPEAIGLEMYGLAGELFPICRSLTGQGVRDTLAIISREVEGLQMHEVESGYKAFDWEVPKEWNIRDGYIKDSKGNKVVDFRENNLHVMGYSESVAKVVSRDELEEHLYSIVEMPDAIPYVTSYYEKRWGFCLSDEKRRELEGEEFEVMIDASLENGKLDYADIVIEGKCKKEILLSTYICHPSMANNEVSGPVVATYIARWLKSRKNRFTYRLVYAPETIGAIVYIEKNFDKLSKNCIGGLVVTCVGDDRGYSYMPSRDGASLTDKAALTVFENLGLECKVYSWLERGSDERQYNAPGVSLNIGSIMRSKYGEYEEYHTSKDDMSVVSPEGFYGAYRAIQEWIRVMEANRVMRATVKCEPQLGKRGLYNTISAKGSSVPSRDLLNVLSFCDGENDMIEISEKCHISFLRVEKIIGLLEREGLIVEAK